MEDCIKVIEDWSMRNGMSLNKEKSGIVVFSHRRATKIPIMKMVKEKVPGKKTMKTRWIPTRKDICGIPICEQYKYLGTILNPKLMFNPQVCHIKKKSAPFIFEIIPLSIKCFC